MCDYVRYEVLVIFCLVVVWPVSVRGCLTTHTRPVTGLRVKSWHLDIVALRARTLLRYQTRSFDEVISSSDVTIALLFPGKNGDLLDCGSVFLTDNCCGYRPLVVRIQWLLLWSVLWRLRWLQLPSRYNKTVISWYISLYLNITNINIDCIYRTPSHSPAFDKSRKTAIEHQ